MARVEMQKKGWGLAMHDDLVFTQTSKTLRNLKIKLPQTDMQNYTILY